MFGFLTSNLMSPLDQAYTSGLTNTAGLKALGSTASNIPNHSEGNAFSVSITTGNKDFGDSLFKNVYTYLPKEQNIIKSIYESNTFYYKANIPSRKEQNTAPKKQPIFDEFNSSAFTKKPLKTKNINTDEFNSSDFTKKPLKTKKINTFENTISQGIVAGLTTTAGTFAAFKLYNIANRPDVRKIRPALLISIGAEIGAAVGIYSGLSVRDTAINSKTREDNRHIRRSDVINHTISGAAIGAGAGLAFNMYASFITKNSRRGIPYNKRTPLIAGLFIGTSVSVGNILTNYIDTQPTPKQSAQGQNQKIESTKLIDLTEIPSYAQKLFDNIKTSTSTSVGKSLKQVTSSVQKLFDNIKTSTSTSVGKSLKQVTSSAQKLLDNFKTSSSTSVGKSVKQQKIDREPTPRKSTEGQDQKREATKLIDLTQVTSSIQELFYNIKTSSSTSADKSVKQVTSYIQNLLDIIKTSTSTSPDNSIKQSKIDREPTPRKSTEGQNQKREATKLIDLTEIPFSVQKLLDSIKTSSSTSAGKSLKQPQKESAISENSTEEKEQMFGFLTRNLMSALGIITSTAAITATAGLTVAAGFGSLNRVGRDTFTRNLMSPLGLAAMAGLTITAGIGALSGTGGNAFSGAFIAGTKHLQNSLFRNPYENIYGANSQQYTANISGRFSSDHTTFYVDGDSFKPVQVDGDLYLAPSLFSNKYREEVISKADRELQQERTVSSSITRLAVTGVGAATGFYAVSSLDNLSDIIHNSGGFSSKLFESSISDYEELAGTSSVSNRPRSLAKNFFPATLGALTGLISSGSWQGALSGAFIGSYVGSYLLMQEQFGPRLKPKFAGALYTALAANIVYDKYFSSQYTKTLTSSTSIQSPLKSKFLNPKLHLASNPYSVTEAEYNNNIKTSTSLPTLNYTSFRLLDFSKGLLNNYKPNYRANTTYKIQQSFENKDDKQSDKAPSTTVFDHLNPISAAYSSAFFATLPFVFSSKFTEFYKDIRPGAAEISHVASLNSLRVFQKTHEIEELAELSDEAFSYKNIFKVVGREVSTDFKSKINYSFKMIGIPSLIGLVTYHSLKNYQHNRSYEITNQEEYKPAAKITVNPFGNMLSQGLVAGLGGAATTLTALKLYNLTALLPKYTRLAGMLSVGAAIGAGVGLYSGVSDWSTTYSNSEIFNKTILGVAIGAGAGLASNMYGNFVTQDLGHVPNIKRRTISSALFFGTAGLLTGYLSSAQFQNTDYSPPETTYQTLIKESSVPSNTSSKHQKFVQDLIDKARYIDLGIHTPIDDKHVFYDSGTVGKGFMNFLRRSKDDSLIGGFYEISSDTEFLSLINRKAKKEGIAVSMGANVSFSQGLSGALGSLYRYALSGPLSPIQYGLSYSINTFTKAAFGFTTYKTSQQLKEDPNELPARISNALVGAGIGAATAPLINYGLTRVADYTSSISTLLSEISDISDISEIPRPIPSENPIRKKLAKDGLVSITSSLNKVSNIVDYITSVRTRHLVGGLAVLGGIVGLSTFSPTLDSTGFKHIQQAFTYLNNTADTIKTYGLTVGEEDKNITGNKYTGGTLEQIFGYLGRIIHTGGLNITDKITPYAMGETYEPGKTDTYTLHTKFIVDTKRKKAFFSTGNVDSLIENSRSKVTEEKYALETSDPEIIKGAQTNYALETSDPEIVQEAIMFSEFLKKAKPEDSFAPLASKFKHLILGGKESSSIQKISAFIKKSNSDVYASMAYPSNLEIVQSFLYTLGEGHGVNILAQNPQGTKAGGNPEKSTQFYRKLFEGGAKLFFLPENSSILVHAKAIASQDSQLITSHNFSDASGRYVSEVGVQLFGKNVGVPLQQAIKRDIYKYGAVEYSREDLIKAKEEKDNRKLLLYEQLFPGITNKSIKELEGKNKATLLLLKPSIEGISGISEDPAEGLVYLPTSISYDYYQKYGFNKNPNIYTKIAYALGYDNPLRRIASSYADYSIQSPLERGLAPYINAAFPNLYRQGEGIIGTGFRGIGRFLDTLTGFYSNLYYSDLRKGLIHGNIKDYNRLSYKKDDRRGVFEKTFSGVFNATSSTIYSLAFYFGVSHTLSIARSHFEDIGTEQILSQLGNTGNLNARTSIEGFYIDADTLKATSEISAVHNKLIARASPDSSTKVLKGKVASSYYDYITAKAAEELGSTTSIIDTDIDSSIKAELDELAAKPEYSLQSRINKAKEELTKAGFDSSKSYKEQKGIVKKVQKDLYRVDVDEGTIGFEGKGIRPNIFSAVSSIRRMDDSHFSNIILPILDEMFVGDENDRTKFQAAVGKLQNIISSPPTVKFKEGDAPLETFEISNFGYKRLEQIAAALDDISRYIPANPLLYFKPYRDAVGVTSLKVTKVESTGETYESAAYSLKSLLGPGFSGLTTFSKNVIKQLKNVVTTNPFEYAKSTFTLFELQNKVIENEIKLNKALTRIFDNLDLPEDFNSKMQGFIDSGHPSNMLKDLSDNLHNQLHRDLITIQVDEEFRALHTEYHENIRNYNEELTKRVDIENVAKTSSTQGLFKTLRSVFFSVGPILILDRLLDPHLMRNSGDLVSQVMAGIFLTRNDEGTQVAQLDYTGGVPSYIKYPIVSAGFILGGQALPRFTTGHEDFGSILNNKLAARYGNFNYVDFIDSLSDETAKKFGGSFINFAENRSSFYFLNPDVLGSARGRIKANFGYMGAFIGASLALLGTQTVFNLASTAFNIFTSSMKSVGPKPQAEELAAGLQITSVIDKTLSKARKDKRLTVGEAAAVEAANLAAYGITYGNKPKNSRLYTFSTQIPTPIFQATLVSKIDPIGNNITFGAGFQFLPILGSGSIPAAPFSIRLNANRSINSLRRESFDLASKVRKNLGSDEHTKNLAVADLLSLLSFPGQLIAIENKDTTLSATINFLGITSYMGQGVNKLERFLYKNLPASDTSNKALSTIYSLTKFTAKSVRTLIGLSQAIPISMANTLYKGTSSLLKFDSQRFFSRSIGSSDLTLGKGIRRVSPYLLAYTFASGITSPEGAFSYLGSHLYPKFDEAEKYRFTQAVMFMTPIYGTALLTSGAFASADSFRQLAESNRTNLSYIESKKALLYNMYSKAGKELPLVRTANIRLQMAARRIFTYQAILSLVGLLYRGMSSGQRPLAFLDIASDSQDDIAKQNPTERLYQGHSQSYARYRPNSLGSALLAYADTLARYSTGIFGVDNLFYRDDPNAFLSFGGPFGITESSPNIYRNYTQVQGGGVSDISGSVVDLVRGGAIFDKSDLAVRIQSILATKNNKDITIKDIADSLIGSLPRKDPMQIRRFISPSEYKIIRNLSESFQLAVTMREYYLRNLAQQRPSELSTQLFFELFSTGNLQGTFTRTKRIYNPLSSIVNNTSFTIKAKTSNPVYEFADSIGRLLRGAGDGSNAAVDDVAGDFYTQNSTLTPFIGYFQETFKYVSGSLTGKNTPGAGIAAFLQTVPLTLFTFGSAFSFAIQMSASLIAVNQGAVSSFLQQSLDDSLSSLKQLKRRHFTVEDTIIKTHFDSTKNSPGRSFDIELSSTTAPQISSSFRDRVATDITNINKTLFEDLINFIEEDDNILKQSIKEINTLKRQLLEADEFVREDIIKQINEHIELIAKEVRTKIETAFGKSIQYTDVATDTKTFQEILNLSQDVPETIASNIELELKASVFDNNLGEDVLKLKVESTVSSQAEQLNRELYNNATVRLNEKPVPKETKNTRSYSKSTSPSENVNLNKLVRERGYLGVISQSFQGLGKVIQIAQDFYGPYEFITGFTYAVRAKEGLDRYKGAYAAADGLFSTAAATAVMGTANFFGLTPYFLPILGALVLGSVMDNMLNKGRISSTVLRTFSYLDESFFEPAKRSLAKNIYNASSFISKIPLISDLIKGSRLLFDPIDSLLTSIHQKLPQNPQVQFVANLLLPLSPTMIDTYRTGRLPRGYAFAGERQEALSIYELSLMQDAIVQQNRRRSASSQGNIDHLVHGYLQGSIYTGNPFIDIPYLQSAEGGSGSRLLARFADPPSISDTLQLAIRQRSIISDFYGVGSYVKRQPKPSDLSGIIFSSLSSLAAAGAASSNNIFGSISYSLNKLFSWAGSAFSFIGQNQYFDKFKSIAAPFTLGITTSLLTKSVFDTTSLPPILNTGISIGAGIATGFALYKADDIKDYLKTAFTSIKGRLASSRTSPTTTSTTKPGFFRQNPFARFFNKSGTPYFNKKTFIPWLLFGTSLTFTAKGIIDSFIPEDKKQDPTLGFLSLLGSSILSSIATTSLSKSFQNKSFTLKNLGKFGLYALAALGVGSLINSTIYYKSTDSNRGLYSLGLGIASVAALSYGLPKVFSLKPLLSASSALESSTELTTDASRKSTRLQKLKNFLYSGYTKGTELFTGLLGFLSGSKEFLKNNIERITESNFYKNLKISELAAKPKQILNKLNTPRSKAIRSVASTQMLSFAITASTQINAIQDIHTLTQDDDRETYRSKYTSFVSSTLATSLYSGFSIFDSIAEANFRKSILRSPLLRAQARSRNFTINNEGHKIKKVGITARHIGYFLMSSLLAYGISHLMGLGNFFGDRAFDEQARNQGFSLTSSAVSFFNQYLNPFSSAIASDKDKPASTSIRTVASILGVSSIVLAGIAHYKAGLNNIIPQIIKIKSSFKSPTITVLETVPETGTETGTETVPKTGTETGRTGTETGRTGTETGRTVPGTGRTGTETGRTGTETGRTGTETVPKTGTETGRTVPGTVPGTETGTGPGTGPGTVPKTGTGTGPGTVPGTGPGTRKTLKIDYMEVGSISNAPDKIINNATVNTNNKTFNDLTEPKELINNQQGYSLKDEVRSKLVPTNVPHNKITTIGYVDLNSNYSVLSISYYDKKTDRVVSKIFYAEGTDPSVMTALIQTSKVESNSSVNHWKKYSGSAVETPLNSSSSTRNLPESPLDRKPAHILKQNTGIQQTATKAFDYSKNIDSPTIHWAHNIDQDAGHSLLKSSGIVLVPYNNKVGQEIANLPALSKNIHPGSFFKPIEQTQIPVIKNTETLQIKPPPEKNIKPEIPQKNIKPEIPQKNIKPEIPQKNIKPEIHDTNINTGYEPLGKTPSQEPTLLLRQEQNPKELMKGLEAVIKHPYNKEVMESLMLNIEKDYIESYLKELNIEKEVNKFIKVKDFRKVSHKTAKLLALYNITAGQKNSQFVDNYSNLVDYYNLQLNTAKNLSRDKIHNIESFNELNDILQEKFSNNEIGGTRGTTISNAFDVSDPTLSWIDEYGKRRFNATFLPFDFEYINKQFKSLLQFGKQKIASGILSVSSSISSLFSRAVKSSFDIIRPIQDNIINIRFPQLSNKVSSSPPKPKPTPKPPNVSSSSRSHNLFDPFHSRTPSTPKPLYNRFLQHPITQKTISVLEHPATQTTLDVLSYAFLVNTVVQPFVEIQSLDPEASREGNPLMSTYRYLKFMDQHDNNMYYDIKSTARKLGSVLTSLTLSFLNVITFPLNLIAGILTGIGTYFVQSPLLKLFEGYFEKQLSDKGFFGLSQFVYRDIAKQSEQGAYIGAAIGAVLAGIGLAIFPPSAPITAPVVISGGALAGGIGGMLSSFNNALNSSVTSSYVPRHPQSLAIQKIASAQARTNTNNQQLIRSLGNNIPAIMTPFIVTQPGRNIPGPVTFADLQTSTRTYPDQSLLNSSISQTIKDKNNNPFRVLVNNKKEELPIVELNLSRPSGGNRWVPSITTGYVEVAPAYGAINIYSDKQRTTLIGRITHLKDVAVRTGDFVTYGQILGQQSGVGPRGSSQFPSGIQVAASKQQISKYLESLQNGKFFENNSSYLSNPSSNTTPSPLRGNNRLSLDEFSKLTALGQQLYTSTLDNKYIRALADVTSYVEGTDFNSSNDSNYGYNMVVGGSRVPFNKLYEVVHPYVSSQGSSAIFSQPTPLTTPFGTIFSTASGRYQILDTHFKNNNSSINKLFDPNKPKTTFSPAVQDLMFRYLLYEKGILNEVSQGQFTDQVLDKVAEIYAGFKTSTGQSVYPGQGTPQGNRDVVRSSLIQRINFYESIEKEDLLVKQRQELNNQLLRAPRNSRKYIDITKKIKLIDQQLTDLRKSRTTSTNPTSKPQYVAAYPKNPSVSQSDQQLITLSKTKLTPKQIALISQEYDDNIEKLKHLKDRPLPTISITISKTHQGQEPKHPNYPNNNPYVVIPKETPSPDYISVTPKEGSPIPEIFITKVNHQPTNIEIFSDPNYFYSLVPREVFLQDPNYFSKPPSNSPNINIF